MKEQEASHTAMTHRQNYPPEKLFSFSCEPNFQSQPQRQPKNTIQDRSFLFIHKPFRMRRNIWGKVEAYLLFPLFPKGNSNVLGEKGAGRMQGRGFSGFIWKALKDHEHNDENQIFFFFFKKSVTGTFWLNKKTKPKICFCLLPSVIYSPLLWRHLLCFSTFLPFFWD